MEVDPTFQEGKAKARARRSKRRNQRFAMIGGAGLLLVMLVGWLLLRTGPDTLADAGDETIIQVEMDDSAAPVRAATPFVDLAGDPLILRFEAGAKVTARTIVGPDDLDPERVGAPRPDRLTLLREPLIVQERQLITALPSSREDFAFFQAQRSAALDSAPVAAIPLPTRAETVVTVEPDGSDDSWGAALGSDRATPATYVETRIENTTSVAFVIPERQRRPLYQDVVVRMVTERSISDVLATNGFDPAGVTTWAAQIIEMMPGAAQMPPGAIIAIRARPAPDGLVPLILSYYRGRDDFVDSLARRGTIGFQRASDPWVDTDLFAFQSPTAARQGPQADYRLLDAVYSALIRQGVPTTLVGEMIVMLSQTYDLEAFAAPGDEVSVLYAPEPGPVGTGPGQILFAGISGPSGAMPCYVSADESGVYSCFTDTGRAAAGSTGQAGFVTPVKGTLTSKFGPRHHPILNDVRLHAGVDWAAPTGTQIVAALDGEVAVVGDGGGYGNVIYIDHAGGLQSRYAHMSKFASGMKQGLRVRAGEVIGYVGTTGRSTGPHLHFEFRLNGAPVDPFGLDFEAGGSRIVAAAGGASLAVEELVNQIIRVESGGNAAARNPLSTATGLGQFIESTWLRMMRDYRPDLAQTMSRSDLLALRTDPTLSREMVTNLARENERFLQSKGHSISAGRLYLAHFLGPAGAATVLSADESARIAAVMGAAVVRANPFLADYTVADLKAWADRKMHGRSTRPAVAPVVVAAPRPVMTAQMQAYKAVIDRLLADAG